MTIHGAMILLWIPRDAPERIDSFSRNAVSKVYGGILYVCWTKFVVGFSFVHVWVHVSLWLKTMATDSCFVSMTHEPFICISF